MNMPCRFLCKPFSFAATWGIIPRKQARWGNNEVQGAKDFHLGVLGGSFNPIHNAHIRIAHAAMEAFSLERVLFIPTGNPPHKRDGLADKWHRLHMVALAVEGEPRFAVSDMEVRREGVAYTVDTLRALRLQWPNANLWFIVGADTLLEMHTWKQPHEILSMCSLIVCTRPGSDEQESRRCAERFGTQGTDIHFLAFPGMDISATRVRQAVQQKEEAAAQFVSPSVWKYIQENKLYAR